MTCAAKKILLVDDEVIVRESMKQMFDWERYGYAIAGEAANGRDALEACAIMQPDIVITDIVMPIMNGLELIRGLKDRFPHIKVIVLTCHSEFSYARESFRLGAVDYLLKYSMDDDRLLNLLETLNKANETEVGAGKAGEPASEHDQRANLLRLKKRYFSELISESYASVDELGQKAELLDIRAKENYLCLLLISSSSKDEAAAENLKKALMEVSDTNGEMEYFEVTAYQYAILLHLPSPSSQRVHDASLNVCRHVVKLIGSGPARALTFCVSEAFGRYSQAAAMYQQTHEAVKHRFYLDRLEIIPMTAARKPFSQQIPDFAAAPFSAAVAGGDYTAIESSVNTLCARMEELNVRPDYARELFITVMSCGIRVLNGHGLSVAELYPGPSTPYSEIVKLETLAEIKAYLLRHFRLLLDKLDEQAVKNYRKEIAAVVQYIKKNYSRDISLRAVAEEVNFSFNYLSQLFKDEVGESFSDFLIRVRMEKAKDLLRETPLKIYEIAKSVGYPDASYFCRLFKKVEDMNPNEYRDKFQSIG